MIWRLFHIPLFLVSVCFLLSLWMADTAYTFHSGRVFLCILIHAKLISTILLSCKVTPIVLLERTQLTWGDSPSNTLHLQNIKPDSFIHYFPVLPDLGGPLSSVMIWRFYCLAAGKVTRLPYTWRGTSYLSPWCCSYVSEYHLNK